MLNRRFNSSWSSVTSLWNRIRGAQAKETVSSAVKSEVGETSVMSSPWAKSPEKTISPLTQFWIRTGMFRVSAQKLNLLGRQISQLPLPNAILQMKFSPKRAAREVHSLLLQAESRIKAGPKGTPEASKFIVQQAVVGKGTYLKRIDIKGRGRHGVIWRPHSFLRLQVGVPDENLLLKKRFKVRIQKENKPIMLRLNY